MKNKTYIFLVFTYLISTISFSQNGEKNFIDQPYIEVTGQVETEIIPNEIYLNITLNENDKKGKVEELENLMISTLKSLNIDLEKNLSIQDFNGFYKRKILASNEVLKVKNYQLIVNDAETLGKVYQAMDKIEVSDISIIKVSHSEIEKLRREAKLEALKVAKEKANDYATTINQTLGKALFIQEMNENNLNHNLSGYTNAIMGISSNYETNSEFQKIQNLNFKTIPIKAIVMAKFMLN